MHLFHLSSFNKFISNTSTAFHWFLFRIRIFWVKPTTNELFRSINWPSESLNIRSRKIAYAHIGKCGVCAAICYASKLTKRYANLHKFQLCIRMKWINVHFIPMAMAFLCVCNTGLQEFRAQKMKFVKIIGWQTCSRVYGRARVVLLW